jgi:trans-aconitate 2-methyltransferase
LDVLQRTDAQRLHGWDASAYDSLALPHRRWGAEAIALLRLEGHETVLDVGCGTGRDVERLLDVLAEGRVVALDASPDMLAQLRTRVGDRLARVTTLCADANEPINLSEPVDAVLSVATLHWLPDHEVVFRNLAAVMRPGARFAADAGGEGNVLAFRKALAEVCGHDGSRSRNFASVDDTVGRLRAAGFGSIDVKLVPDPLRLNPGTQFESFLATLMLVPEQHDLPADERVRLVKAVATRMVDPVIDFVRLNINATRE